MYISVKRLDSNLRISYQNMFAVFVIPWGTLESKSYFCCLACLANTRGEQ